MSCLCCFCCLLLLLLSSTVVDLRFIVLWFVIQCQRYLSAFLTSWLLACVALLSFLVGRVARRRPRPCPSSAAAGAAAATVTRLFPAGRRRTPPPGAPVGLLQTTRDKPPPLSSCHSFQISACAFELGRGLSSKKTLKFSCSHHRPSSSGFWRYGI